MDFMKAVSYPFDDEDWLKKVGVAVLVQLIPLLGSMIVLPGWAYYTARNVKNGSPNPLPGWDDFGGMLGKGFTLFLAGVVYQIPTILVACVISVVQFLPLLGLSDDNTAGALAGVAGIIIACCSCLVLIYALIAWFVYMAGYIRFMDTEEFSTFMQFSDNIALARENMQTFLMLMVWTIVASIGAGFVTSFVAGLGRQAIISWVTGHLIGQAAIELQGGSVAMDVASSV